MGLDLEPTVLGDSPSAHPFFQEEPPPCTWAKPGRFGSQFVLCFLALGGHCLQMLCLPGFGTHPNTQNFHIFVLSLPVSRSTLPRNAYFSWQTLPNRPGFARLPVYPFSQETYLSGSQRSTLRCHCAPPYVRNPQGHLQSIFF